MFQVGRHVSQQMKLSLPDYRLQFLANNCQGDMRCLYQGLEVHANSKPYANSEVDEMPEQEAWSIYAKKELEVNPLYNIENLLIPTNKATYHQY